MKKLGLKLSDIRSMMEATYRRIGSVTGHVDVDLTKEQHHSRTIPTPKSEASNEEVLVCWGAVSAASSADDLTPNDFDAGLLLTGHAEPEVTGAIILTMCDRLLKVGVEAGAFPDISVSLAMLASSIIPDMSDDDRCGHA
jgi:hypothetical protein